MTLKNYFSKPSSNGIFWGVIGGIALIVLMQFTLGPKIMSPYFPILLIAISTIAFSQKSNIKINKLFVSGFLTFAIMTLFLYLYLMIFNPNPSITLFGHFWRIGAMAAIGIFSSFIGTSVVYKLMKWSNK